MLTTTTNSVPHSSALQSELFDMPVALPNGFIYRQNFITADEEETFALQCFQLPFSDLHFQEYVARRRVVSYDCGEYSSSVTTDVEPRRPIPEFLMPLRRQVGRWLGIDEARFVNVLITEYRTGTSHGWHSDAPHFGTVVGISLVGHARMRFRPYANLRDRSAVIAINLEPRSVYVLQGEIRWRWQHHIPPTKELRYSVTFRTLQPATDS